MTVFDPKEMVNLINSIAIHKLHRAANLSLRDIFLGFAVITNCPGSRNGRQVGFIDQPSNAIVVVEWGWGLGRVNRRLVKGHAQR